jgi:hypothetical protein
MAQQGLPARWQVVIQLFDLDSCMKHHPLIGPQDRACWERAMDPHPSRLTLSRASESGGLDIHCQAAKESYSDHDSFARL